MFLGLGEGDERLGLLHDLSVGSDRRPCSLHAVLMPHFATFPDRYDEPHASRVASQLA